MKTAIFLVAGASAAEGAPMQGSVNGQGEQVNTKSEPGAVATGRILKFLKGFALLASVFTIESLAGRYRSRF